MPIGLEAVCKKCGETFNPHSESEEDLEHTLMQDQETWCGGQGAVVGSWGQ